MRVSFKLFAAALALGQLAFMPPATLAQQIAAHALALDITLVTNNVREFERVPGLRVENWV